MARIEEMDMSPVRKTSPKQKASATTQKRAKKNASVKRKGQKMAADDTGAQDLGEALETSGNLGQVRDILFGSQMRDYDKRFARVEERIVSDIQSLKDDVRNQFESLETFVNKEVESLIDRLKDEQADRVGAVKEVTKEVSDLTRTVEKRTTKLDEQLTKVERDTRQQLLDQSKTLRDETQQKFDELRRVLENEADELRDSKTDRAMLADLMTEVAMRLRNEFELPDA
jgi:low affinity Fe/Cu permease